MNVTPSAGQPELLRAATGVCDALAALPDPPAAERTFTNVAHDALHELAADPRLDRSLAAPVLEAMDRVEADFDGTAAALPDDLGRLHDAARTALHTIGIEAAACPA